MQYTHTSPGNHSMYLRAFIGTTGHPEHLQELYSIHLIGHTHMCMHALFDSTFLRQINFVEYEYRTIACMERQLIRAKNHDESLRFKRRMRAHQYNSLRYRKYRQPVGPSD